MQALAVDHRLRDRNVCLDVRFKSEHVVSGEVHHCGGDLFLVPPEISRPIHQRDEMAFHLFLQLQDAVGVIR